MKERIARSLARLAALAQTAEVHASAEDDLAAMDRAIDASRESGDIENVGLCYGAWLGETLRRESGAAWVGLLEPSAPRMLVADKVISPIDAVLRRLKSATAPSLAQIIETAKGWKNSSKYREEILESNRKAWNGLADSPRFAGISPELMEPEAALDAVDPWIADEGLKGKTILCLGAGGGRQGPLHLAAGAAEVVVVDLSDAQLELDRKFVGKIRTVQTSMDELSGLESASFDLVIQPVASSYVPDVSKVHREVARVLKPAGLYVVQHKQPAALRSRPPVDGLHEKGCIEFPHSLELLMGDLCRNGFVIEDFVEPPLGDALAPEGSFEYRAASLPPYLKIKARRKAR